MYGAARFEAGKWEQFLSGNGMYGIVAMPEAGLGFVVGNGLKFLDSKGKVTTVRVGCGAKSERWGCPVFDTAGQLWVGGRWSNGLAIRRTDGTWVRWSKAENRVPNDTCQALLPDTDGSMLVGFGSGLRKWTQSNWQEIKLPAELGRSVTALARNSQGDLWVAVHGSTSGGVVCLHKDGTMRVLTAPPLPSQRITAILPAKDGTVWFASRRGVARLSSNEQWTMFTACNSGLICDHVLALAEDGRGQVWFATANGVSVFRSIGD
jgi:ligand-binding sensor domain-containing protein